MEFLTEPSYQEMLSYLILFAVMVIVIASPIIVVMLMAAWRQR